MNKFPPKDLIIHTTEAMDLSQNVTGFLVCCKPFTVTNKLKEVSLCFLASVPILIGLVYLSQYLCID